MRLIIIFQFIENKYIIYIWVKKKKFNKIFIIGLNKTASTTIHNFFKANKFKSIHWQTQLFEKKYQLDKTEESVLHNKENNKNLLDKELDETFQVFSDIQNLSLNFELLDKQYPNSLFIIIVM